MPKAKVKTLWMKKQKPDKQQETVRKAYMNIMGKPKGLSPMAEHILPFEGDVKKTVEAMKEFQADHCCSGKQIALLKTINGRVRRWFGCDVCGQVTMKESTT